MVQRGKTRLAGITLTKKRNVVLMESVLALMLYPKGFSCADLKEIMHKKQFKDYTISNARYDMRKLKGKKFVQKIKGKQNYQATKQGIQTMLSALCVWKQELKPFLTLVNKEGIGIDGHSKEFNTVKMHFFNARREISSISNLYDIKWPVEKVSTLLIVFYHLVPKVKISWIKEPHRMFWKLQK